MPMASGAGPWRRQGARGCRRNIWCRSGPRSGAMEKEFRGGVSQHGSAKLRARLTISVDSHRVEGGQMHAAGLGK
eukprot:1008155-Pelagomonas_calceolata.AAC.1